jgi:capsular exopolysaccharide synthesis family protein
VIEPAKVPEDPLEGPKRLIILLGLLFSLGGGVCCAMFLDYLDNSIKSLDEVAQYTKLPVLGVIPQIGGLTANGKVGQKIGILQDESKEGVYGWPKSDRALVKRVSVQSPLAEAYKTLRTSVLLSSAEGSPRTILVTSAQPNDGKTITVLNLAVSLSQLGSSVLIIDCDLRRPMTHKVFDVDTQPGLSTYLSSDLDDDSIIRGLPIDNLWLIPSGPLPPNPAELISSAKMKTMLHDLSLRFDHILIDSPPISNVTDPVILSTLVDGVVLVVRDRKSKREAVRRARRELSAVGARVIGVVLNGTKMHQMKYDEY